MRFLWLALLVLIASSASAQVTARSTLTMNGTGGPVVTFNCNPTTIVPGKTTVCTGSGVSGLPFTSWNWSSDICGVPSLNTDHSVATFTCSTSGTATISLNVTNTIGTSPTVAQQITVTNGVLGAPGQPTLVP